MPIHHRCLVLVVAAVASYASAGPILPLEQDRAVSTLVIVPPCQQQDGTSEQAQGFEDFLGEIETVVSCDEALSFALAGQVSSIDNAALAGTGHALSSANGTGAIFSLATNIFEVHFEVVEPVSFDLSMSLAAGASSAAIATQVVAMVSLVGGPDYGDVVELTVSPKPDGSFNEQALAATGTLAPDVYTLSADAVALINNMVPPSAYGNASFEFTIAFTFVCTGDLDGDSLVNGADVGLLLGAWGTDDPLTDLNLDGTVDGQDLGILLANWGPCPG